MMLEHAVPLHSTALQGEQHSPSSKLLWKEIHRPVKSPTPCPRLLQQPVVMGEQENAFEEVSTALNLSEKKGRKSWTGKI